jgi:subtilisin family serine protease
VRKAKTAAGMSLLLAVSMTALPADAQSETRSRPQADARSVTLITGDRVILTEGGPVITPGEGRGKVDFHTYDQGGRLRVVPGDAIEPMRRGRLDPRLFDVTALIESGYDDRRPNLPLIVTGASATRSLRGATGHRPLGAVDGFAVRQDRAQAVRFWQDLGGVGGMGGKVWLDARVKLSLDTSVKQIGAPAAWAKGLTGAGVKVAVLDTGIDAAHPDLAGKVVARADFTETPDERDVDGHGTHVAATIAGGGDRYRGVAPEAELLDGKVCEPQGGCPYSALLAGMQWAVDQGARVVNLSLGGSDEPGLDPLEEAVQRLTESHGTLFVAAAGNVGKDRTVSTPASADAALAVGAVDGTDRLADFSSRGPRVGDSGLKPDITAPGVEITAARGKDSPGSGSHVAMSGTSMATPHVAGTAALLAGAHATWKAGDLKAALMGSAPDRHPVGSVRAGGRTGRRRPRDHPDGDRGSAEPGVRAPAVAPRRRPDSHEEADLPQPR